MTDAARAGQFLGQRINEKQTHEVIGLARGLLADGHLSDHEIHFLHKYLVASEAAQTNPLVSRLVQRVKEAVADGLISEEERTDLTAIMTSLTANDFELGEVLKATSLPLCVPAPALNFTDARISFTGTFVFGKRHECETAAAALGAICGNLTQKTRYLVIGEYATESWKFSSFGNKIMQAAEWRDRGVPINIVSEQHWRKYLA
ncbi:BRCT domain-containing protein [Falsigemmobacter faecalis]|uniref:NAD-dependent DNA ligase n=1 Tax=Falsigemmobacter faecalis TaxID=2488730 RepID=A0A3P3DCE9_9RHOB|nr:BRCT domain-containing protein [Falsigemmobacter faecalis]RRH72005.1 NAD-dependent DNA ligase [Falsigemmobacter faecalis]